MILRSSWIARVEAAWQERTVVWLSGVRRIGKTVLCRRLLQGGFPELLVGPESGQVFFEEWIDSFYARDIQELFGVRNRSAFLNLFKLALMRSGGLLDVTDLSKRA